MTKIKNNWIVYLLVLLVVVPLAFAWGGPPPAEIVYYGYAYINGSVAPPGTQLQILANGNSLVMDTDSVISGGYFPGLQMIWDDPDTGTDEGITYSDNAENIYFKIAGQTTNYPAYITATTSQAGQAILINLSFIYNFPPILDFISNQTFTEDVSKCFNITASDNNSYRNDTLSYSDNAPGTLSKINDNLAQFCWTPTNTNAIVGNYTFTYTVTDDGSPSKSDSQLVGIEVLNVNDAPTLNIPNQVAFINQTFNLAVSSYADDIDPTGDTLNYTDNSTLFDINLTTGLISFTPNATEIHSIQITVCDNHGACTSDTFTLTILAEEKVVIRKNIEYLGTSGSDLLYQVTNKIYNFLGSDLVDAPFNDSDIGYNGTVNITDERSVTISGNITVPASGSTFNFAQSNLISGAAVYYSNQPIILAGSITTGGGGGGGGGSCSCPTCPTTCPTCPPCPQPKKVKVCHNGNTIEISINALPSHLEQGDTYGECPPQELEELPPEIEKPRYFIQIIKWKYSWIIAIAVILLILLFLLRLWLLKRKVKKFLKYVRRSGRFFHFVYGPHNMSLKVDDVKKLNGAFYIKRNQREFMDKIKLKNPFSRFWYSIKAMFKIRQGPFETTFALSRIKKAILHPEKIKK